MTTPNDGPRNPQTGSEPPAMRSDGASPSSRNAKPFDWMQPRRAVGQASKDKAGREAMYRAELEERAALLHRLGHGKQQTRARLAGNLAWDFAPDASPLTPAVLDAIVDRVYGQATPTRTTTRKGGTK